MISSPVFPDIDSMQSLCKCKCMIEIVMLVNEICAADVRGCFLPLLDVRYFFLQAAVHDADGRAEPHMTMAGCPELCVYQQHLVGFHFHV